MAWNGSMKSAGKILEKNITGKFHSQNITKGLRTLIFSYFSGIIYFSNFSYYVMPYIYYIFVI